MHFELRCNNIDELELSIYIYYFVQSHLLMAKKRCPLNENVLTSRLITHSTTVQNLILIIRHKFTCCCTIYMNSFPF